VKPSNRAPLESSPRERNGIRLRTNRCPYCHDDVSVEATDWVSCRGCQARHHDSCWDELGVCASCAEEGRLQTPAQQAEPERLRSGPGALLIPLLLFFAYLLGSFSLGPLYLVYAGFLACGALQTLLNPLLVLDPTGMEIRRGLHGVRVRYEDVLSSKRGCLPWTWTLQAQQDGVTRWISVSLLELRKEDRARVRAIFEGLPRRKPEKPASSAEGHGDSEGRPKLKA